MFVVLKNGTEFFGRLFLQGDERVQDILNDSRRFIPLERHYENRGRGSEDIWKIIVLSKDSIQSIEER